MVRKVILRTTDPKKAFAAALQEGARVTRIPIRTPLGKPPRGFEVSINVPANKMFQALRGSKNKLTKSI
ncbi:MAG: hypothetical protein CMI54_07770 [Parcubacteria group bacterium]|nr:hypothetical protein [Parcubacteria group bacterium]